MKRFTSLRVLLASLAAVAMVFAGLPASADQSETPAYDLPFDGESVYEVTCDSLTVHVPEMSGDIRDEELGRYEYWLGDVQADSLFYAEVTPLYVGPDPWGAELDVPYELEAGTYRLELDLYASNGFHETIDGDEIVITGCEEEPEPPVDPAGISIYDTSQCEVLDLGIPTGIQPEDADWQYFINAEPIGVGEYPVQPGEYTLELDVNGETVDTDLVTIAECEDEPVPPTREFTRWWGQDRYGTAAQFALNGGWEPGGTVYITTGQDMPDALSVSGLASLGSGAVSSVGVTVDGPPILLVKADQVPQVTRQALDQLEPSQIVVVGSEAAVSADVEQQLGDWAPVERIGGTDRYDTAARLATQGDHDVIYLVSGEVFADALPAGPLSRWTGGALLLAKQDNLPAVTADALADLQPARVVVIGGSDRVSDTVAQAAADAAGLAGPPERVAGVDRYRTAQLVAKEFPDNVPTSTLVVATGADYPDALTAGAYAGNQGSPVLLVQPNHVPNGTDEAAQYRPAQQLVVLAGGENAVSADVFDSLPGLFE